MCMLLSTTTDNMIGVGVHDVTDDVGSELGHGVGGVRDLGVVGVSGLALHLSTT